MSEYWNVDAYQKKDVQFQYVVKPSDDETQGATAANQQKNEPVVQGQKKATTDEVKLEKKKPTEADNVSRRSAAIVNESETKKTANTAYGAKLAESIEDKNLKEEALAMTEAINKGNEAKAAESYARLQKAGVFTEEVGKPPYAEALEKHIQEQKNQELAKDVVDDMNTDKGMRSITSTYESFGATKKDVKNYVKNELGIKHGQGQIAKAVIKNREHLNKQLALNDVIVDDGTDTSKPYKFNTQNGKTLVFTGTAKDAYKFVKEHSSEIYGKEWDKKAPPAAYMSQKGYAAAKKLNELAKKEGKGFISESGQINVEKAQAYAREKVSMAGDRGDQNELKALAGELNVKEKDVKAMLRGINIDYQKDRRWVGHVVGGVLGAGVAATDLATGFMGSQVGKTIETTITGGKIIETVVQPGVIKKETVKIGPDGKEQRFTEYVTTPGSTTSTSTPGSESTNETPNKRKIGAGDVIKDLALGYTVYDLTSKGLNKVLMHDPQILKKGHTLADALDNPDKNYLKKKSNNEVMSLISKAELKGYTPAETRAIKLQLLEKCMGDSGEKLNRRELFGVLATLKSIPPKAETSTPSGEQTPPPGEQTPPPFDPSKYGTNYKFGDRFWNDAMPNADDPNKKGGWVTNKDGGFVTEIAGERADEIGSFAVDNKILARHKNDKHKLENAPIQQGVEHDNAANANKAGATRYEYIHGLTNGNTRAVADAEYIAEVGVEEAAKNPRQVEIQDPTRGNKYVLERQENGQYKLVSAKRKDGTDLPRNDSQIYNMTAVKKADKNTENNVESGYEYQFFNAAGQGNGDGISVSDDVTAQIQADYAKKHQVKKGKRR